MLRIGLTGGIGSGKSMVASLFQELSAPIVDTDLLAREVVEPGEPLLEAIVRIFGPDLLRPDGRLDRNALRARIFAAPELRRQLETMTHPAIAERLEDRIAQLPARTPYVVLVIPLLIEAGWQSRVDRILVVDCAESVQAERVQQRDGSDAGMAWAMIRAQTSREERLHAADDVIENGGASSLDALAQRVRVLDGLYRTLANQSL